MCIFNIISLIFLIFFDVQYYIRIIFVFLFGRLFEKEQKVTDPTVIYGFCFTQDLDLAFQHMNNARFLRDLDFARFHFYDRSGLCGEMVRRKSLALQTATNIRYRRVIPIFTFYKIFTQVIYWDERNIYVEQKFITNDGFVRAIVLSKQTMMKTNVEDIMKSLNAGPKPEIPRDLDLWLQSMEVSSERLREKQD